MTLPSIYFPGSLEVFFVILIRPLEIRNISSHITREKRGNQNHSESIQVSCGVFQTFLAHSCMVVQPFEKRWDKHETCCGTQSAANKIDNHMIEWLTATDEGVDLINLFSLL